MPQVSTTRPVGASDVREQHPFSLAVEPLATRAGRYRWVIHEEGGQPKSSQESYATRREALAAGDKAMRKFVTLWRAAR